MNTQSIPGVNEGNFPANGSPRQKLEFVLTYAALAPTETNWQPWYFRVGDAQIELMAKNNPVREETDPDRREFMIGCGSALWYLKQALKHFGCLGRVNLFPDLGEPALVAKLHFGSIHERDGRETRLFKAMAGRRAFGSPLGDPPVTGVMLAVLDHAAAGERGWVDFIQSEVSRRQVLEVALAKGSSWPAPDRGNLQSTNGPHRPEPDLARGGRGMNAWDETDEPAISTATLAVVKTKTDDKHGWVEAGQTMARTILQAQALGMPWAFFNPVRRRGAREALRTGVGHKGFAQVILRFGPLMDQGMTGLAAPVTAPELFQ
jgi:hypothetical protein